MASTSGKSDEMQMIAMPTGYGTEPVGAFAKSSVTAGRPRSGFRLMRGTRYFGWIDPFRTTSWAAAS